MEGSKMGENLKELSRLLKESKIKISGHNAASKAEGAIKTEYEHRLINAMEAAGTTSVNNEYGGFFRQEALQPVAKDWELIYDYIRENDAFHILSKSIIASVYREMLEAGEELPGTESFNRVTISVHKPK